MSFGCGEVSLGALVHSNNYQYRLLKMAGLIIISAVLLLL